MAKSATGPTPAARLVRQQWALGSGPLGDLIALGSLTLRAAGFLAAAAGLNILVAGSTQTGNPASCQYAHKDEVGVAKTSS